VSVPWPDVTGAQHPPPPAGDSLPAARARAAELGVPLSDNVRDQLRRARGDQVWERALAEAGEAGEAGPTTGERERAARRAQWEELAADLLADANDPASREALWRSVRRRPPPAAGSGRPGPVSSAQIALPGPGRF